MDLSRKHELFVAEYLISTNATKAAIAAGYAENSAAVTGCKLLRKANIQAAIEAETAKRFTKLEITAERVLKELARIAFFDPRKLFNADGSPKQINELDDDTAAVIAGLQVQELLAGTGDNKHAHSLSRKYKLADKRGALELLGKRLNLFNGKNDAADILEQMETPFEVHIHTYIPGQEPEQMRELMEMSSKGAPS
jgi:phage terminase small subunit